MDLNAVDVGRFGIGRFGDLRLQKRGRGAMRHWLLHRGLAFWSLLAGSGAVRLDLGGFYVIQQ